MAKVPLTRKRKLHAEETGETRFYGRALTHPDRVEARYRAALERAVALMTGEAERMVEALWTQHSTFDVAMDASLEAQARILSNAMARKFQAFFDKLAPPAAAKFVAGVDAHSKADLHGSLSAASGGLSLKTSVITGRVRQIVAAATVENVGLIKSIPQQYFQKLQGDVMRAITSGNGVADVLKSVRATGQVTERRAALIARDQSSKTTTAINAARMDALGVTEFEWMHSGGGKEPRPLHKNGLDGNVYSLKEPPVIDERTGERGLPGQLINCGCRMRPVIKFGAASDAPPAAVTEPDKPAARKRPTLADKLGMTPGDLATREILLKLGRRDKVEFLQAVDEAGKTVVPVYRGKSASVGISEELERLIIDPAQRIAIHHNHPGSSSLSANDLNMMNVAPGLSRVWAHGHDGSVYSAKRGVNPYAKHMSEGLVKTINGRFSALIHGGEKINVADINKVYWHMVNLILHKQKRIEYEAVLSKSGQDAYLRLKPYIDRLLEEVGP